MDKIVKDCRDRIAAKGFNLECVGMKRDMVFEL
jgi:hypothetical protein